MTTRFYTGKSKESGEDKRLPKPDLDSEFEPSCTETAAESTHYDSDHSDVDMIHGRKRSRTGSRKPFRKENHQQAERKRLLVRTAVDLTTPITETTQEAFIRTYNIRPLTSELAYIPNNDIVDSVFDLPLYDPDNCNYSLLEVQVCLYEHEMWDGW